MLAGSGEGAFGGGGWSQVWHWKGASWVSSDCSAICAPLCGVLSLTILPTTLSSQSLWLVSPLPALPLTSSGGAEAPPWSPPCPPPPSSWSGPEMELGELRLNGVVDERQKEWKGQLRVRI